MIHHPFDINVFEIVQTAPANPAAGANYAFTLPIAKRIRLASCNLTLTCDANIANRHVHVRLQDAVRNWLDVMCTTAITAGITSTLHFMQGSTGFQNPAMILGIQHLSIGSHLIFQNLTTFNIVVDNIQVGDQLSAINFVFHTWIDPQAP